MRLPGTGVTDGRDMTCVLEIESQSSLLSHLLSLFLFFKKDFTFNYVYMCVSVCGYAHLKLKCSASRGQKGHQTPQKLELVVSPLT